jgi:hypothetical protein
MTDFAEMAEQGLGMRPSENGAMNPSAAANPGLDKRRSTRVVQAMPIKVHGVDALSEPFTERTSTVMVSCHGCKFQSRHYVPKGSIVTVEIPRRNPNAPARIVAGSVIWVQRPSHARELLHIGLEFEVAGNVWDISDAPDDWFPLPGEPEITAEEISGPQAVAVPVPAAPVTLTASWDASEILVMAGRAEGHEEAVATAMQQAKSAAQQARAIAAEAAAETLSMVRPKTETTGLHETIEHAVRASMERLSEAIIEDVRRAHQEAAERLDSKIQLAVAEAMKALPGRRPNRGKNKN